MPVDYMDINSIYMANDITFTTTSQTNTQPDFTWWTRTPYYTAYATDNRQYTAVYARECEPEAEEFDITEVEKYIDSLKKEVVETES